MKKVLLTLLAVIVIAGVLAGAGFAGYRFGYMRGVTTALKLKTQLPPSANKGFDPNSMPMHDFGENSNRGPNPNFGPNGMMQGFGDNSERGFKRGFDHHGFGMMGPGRGFGFFAPLAFLVHIAFMGLIIWLVYKAIKGSGWTITRRTVETPAAEEKSK